MTKNRTGLVIGFFSAGCHLAWLLLVAAGIAKPLLDWVLSLHFFSVTYSINPFQPGLAAALVLYAFSMGYLSGWILAALWNACRR